MEESPLLKDIFNAALVQELADQLYNVYPAFSRQRFVEEILTDFHSLELKARVGRIAAGYRHHLPEPYPEALELLLLNLGPELTDDGELTASGFSYWPVAHFIEMYGLEHPEESILGMYEVTKRFSAEFAIRPFLVKYPKRMLEVLQEWVSDENLHVRRLVSEGTRTRLPWGQRLTHFIKDPTPVIPLLEALKDDPELYVRRSVANNLNDLSKDHPDLAVTLAETWANEASKDLHWLIRHGLRSLIKAGDDRALALLGFGPASVDILAFSTSPSKLRFGDSLELTLEISNTGTQQQNLMVDYRIHFVKANGKSSPKVFKWTQKTLGPGERITLTKRQAIRPITTRRYYPGLHKVDVQINGKILAETEFLLEEVI